MIWRKWKVEREWQRIKGFVRKEERFEIPDCWKAESQEGTFWIPISLLDRIAGTTEVSIADDTSVEKLDRYYGNYVGSLFSFLNSFGDREFYGAVDLTRDGRGGGEVSVLNEDGRHRILALIDNLLVRDLPVPKVKVRLKEIYWKGEVEQLAANWEVYYGDCESVRKVAGFFERYFSLVCRTEYLKKGAVLKILKLQSDKEVGKYLREIPLKRLNPFLERELKRQELRKARWQRLKWLLRERKSANLVEAFVRDKSLCSLVRQLYSRAECHLSRDFPVGGVVFFEGRPILCLVQSERESAKAGELFKGVKVYRFAYNELGKPIFV